MKKSFEGTLFLIVGNSGSGKDSIIEGVVEKYPKNCKKLYKVKRYITRLPSKTEANIYLSPKEFKQYKNQGKFALSWHIYGFDYGVPIAINDWLENGHPVIVNVSRTIIEKAKKIYKNIRIVFIQVPFELILKRIKERERENEADVNERISRARSLQTFPEADYTVDNSRDLESAIIQCLNYILRVMDES